ncbi:type 2 isopentenyl-diphosphate Delta-isomerase [Nocardia otitidiscaviarum]|uniref:type 2 isopentenyl-diphosphate Delta-isomerase n=1 Tax=Nocardia otitidiscaviarum TaxID=1823 RepID=UPI002455CE4B|nr:type 2 isopentenyl-diphosphate Delta-isomerase [Nocardia otitidiscaviarum]
MTIADRKNAHVDLAVDQQRRAVGSNDFDDVRFIHHALAGIDCADVDLTTSIAGIALRAPFFINAMTGGSDRTGQINRELAIAAAATGIPIATGSMSAYLRDESIADSFRVVRQKNPDGVVMANVNANVTVDQARRAIDLVAANVLQIHLNAVQEIVMGEGDRCFSHWPERIAQIAASADVPVMVKEVGFGLSRNTVLRLRDCGVAIADVGGRGGTNFARIENDRHLDPLVDYSFIEHWGQSTAASLLDNAGVTGIDVTATGGIRSPLDVARCLALGATACGVAGRFLKILLDRGVDDLVATINHWCEQLARIMAVLGASTPESLAHRDLLITGELLQFCRARGIEVTAYARRSTQETAADSTPAEGKSPA